jgi:hypothetical protein
MAQRDLVLGARLRRTGGRHDPEQHENRAESHHHKAHASSALDPAPRRDVPLVRRDAPDLALQLLQRFSLAPPACHPSPLFPVGHLNAKRGAGQPDFPDKHARKRADVDQIFPDGRAMRALGPKAMS